MWNVRTACADHIDQIVTVALAQKRKLLRTKRGATGQTDDVRGHLDRIQVRGLEHVSDRNHPHRRYGGQHRPRIRSEKCCATIRGHAIHDLVKTASVDAHSPRVETCGRDIDERGMAVEIILPGCPYGTDHERYQRQSCENREKKTTVHLNTPYPSPGITKRTKNVRIKCATGKRTLTDSLVPTK